MDIRSNEFDLAQSNWLYTTILKKSAFMTNALTKLPKNLPWLNWLLPFYHGDGSIEWNSINFYVCSTQKQKV